MDHLELLDGGLFAESSLLDDIPAQKPRSADLADLPMSAAGGMPVPMWRSIRRSSAPNGKRYGSRLGYRSHRSRRTPSGIWGGC